MVLFRGPLKRRGPQERTPACSLGKGRTETIDLARYSWRSDTFPLVMMYFDTPALEPRLVFVEVHL